MSRPTYANQRSADWPPPIVPPFNWRQTIDTDEKQGPGSGRPYFIVTDSKGHFLTGHYSAKMAMVGVQTAETLFEAGFRLGLRSRNSKPEPLKLAGNAQLPGDEPPAVAGSIGSAREGAK